MADEKKPPAGAGAKVSATVATAPGTGKTQDLTKSEKASFKDRVREMEMHNRLKARDERAMSSPENFREAFSVKGARVMSNLEIGVTDVLGSKIGSSIRQARRAEPGKKLSTFGGAYLRELTATIGGMGIVGETIANKLRSQRKFEDDPQKEFERIQGNFMNVANDLKQINQNFETLKANQEKIIKADKEVANKLGDLNTTVEKVKNEFYEFQNVNFREFRDSVERRLTTLEGKSKMSSGIGGDGSFAKSKGTSGQQTSAGPSLADIAITAAGAGAGASVAARALGYAKGAGKFLLRRSPYAIAAYGLYKGIETIGEANEARDKSLGIDRNDPRMLTPEGQAEIETKRREYHGRRKRGVNEEYRAQLEEAKKQAGQTPSTTKPATQQKSGPLGLGGFPSTKPTAQQQYAKRFKSESSFGESFDRQMIEREKSSFLQFGQLPRGFEFLPGQMGRLGSPEAVAARGAMPLGGYGEVAGVAGMPRGGYPEGGGLATGIASPQRVAQSGRESTYAGGRTVGPAIDDRTVYGNKDPSKPSGAEVGRTSHPYNVDQRAKLYDEIKNTPMLREWIGGVLKKEGDPTAVLESIVNRALMNGQSLSRATNFNYSGNTAESFFGPIRRREVSPIRNNPHMDRAFKEVFEQGSNIIGYRTDQGMRGEHKPAEKVGLGHTVKGIRGEYFSQMGKKGAQFAQRQEQGRAEWERKNPQFRQPQGLPQSQTEPAPGTATAPAPGAPGTQAPQIIPGYTPQQQTQTQQPMPGVSISPIKTELLPGLTKQQPGKVEEAQQKEAAHRRLPISEELKKQLAYAASEAGVEVRIASGGQDPRIPGTTPPGASPRHNYGKSADLDLYITEDGKRRKLDMRNPADAAIMEKFTRAAVRAGATGVGAGLEYMGAHRLHIGGGSVASWGGKGIPAPEWMQRAHAQGIKGQAGFNVEEWYKNNKAPIKVEAAPELTPENQKRLLEIYERETGKRAGALGITTQAYKDWLDKNQEAYARVLEQPQLPGTAFTGRMPETTLPTPTAIPQFAQPKKQLDARFVGLPEGQTVTPTETVPQITPMQPVAQTAPATTPVQPPEPTGGAFAAIPSTATPGVAPPPAQTTPAPVAAPYTPPPGLGTGVPVTPMPMPPQTLPQPAAPLPGGSAVGGVLGGMRPSEAAPQPQQSEGERAYREAITPPVASPQQQYTGPSAPTTPQEGSGRSGSSGQSTGAGNGRNNPESSGASPGSGGMGSYGRCFV